MTVRSTALALTAAAAFAAVPATAAIAATGAADAWRFKGQYRTLLGCQNAGRVYVARHQATAYKCENDYAAGDVPVLDLYIR
ncbi:MAG TPA: hypothetical protein VF069_20345 [Streptosporangiaceae bacterium]